MIEAPKVRINTPEGATQDDIIKALRETANKLEKDTHSKATDGFSKASPAAKHIIDFVNESYKIMIESMSQEILKVLDPDASDR